jgi:hypothetical protein
VDYVSNVSRVALYMAAPLILIVDMVQAQNLPSRCLWVMRGVQPAQNG